MNQIFFPKATERNQVETRTFPWVLVKFSNFSMLCPHRMLVYEYVDNGNLEQWLHGDVEPANTLTWDIRMKIAVGTAKG